MAQLVALTKWVASMEADFGSGSAEENREMQRKIAEGNDLIDRIIEGNLQTLDVVAPPPTLSKEGLKVKERFQRLSFEQQVLLVESTGLPFRKLADDE